ncbi:MAG TPA: hypothetical protein VNV41_20855 [Candidatus Acidoferrales bacterium]|jgi:hypothetical protein|nr:hypothetical protein [Candidatus Acidoferrales bacterium]
MGKVTHDQVDLMLRLYEMRREPRMREARDWYFTKFHPTSLEDISRQAPMGGPENAYMRMVISYWEMVASIVNRGLIDEGFFFENTGEQWLVWDRIKAFVPAMRARSKNPHQYGNLEKHVKKLELWRKKRAPGMSEAMRQMMMQMQQAAPKTSGD